MNANSDTAAGDDELRLLNFSCDSDDARLVRRSSPALLRGLLLSSENFFDSDLRMPGSDLLCLGPLPSTQLGKRLCCTMGSMGGRSVCTGLDAARVCMGRGKLLIVLVAM